MNAINKHFSGGNLLLVGCYGFSGLETRVETQTLTEEKLLCTLYLEPRAGISPKLAQIHH